MESEEKHNAGVKIDRCVFFFFTFEEFKCSNDVRMSSREAYLALLFDSVAFTFIWTLALYAIGSTVFSTDHFALASS